VPHEHNILSDQVIADSALLSASKQPTLDTPLAGVRVGLGGLSWAPWSFLEENMGVTISPDVLVERENGHGFSPAHRRFASLRDATSQYPRSCRYKLAASGSLTKILPRGSERTRRQV